MRFASRALSVGGATLCALLIFGTVGVDNGLGSTCKTTKHHACAHKPKPKPSPAKLAATIAVGAPVFDLTDGFGSVWARTGSDTTNGGDTVVRIDPLTNAVSARISVGKGFGIAVGDGAVWVVSGVDETLSRIDPTTNAVVATIPLPDYDADAVATSPGSVWVGTDGAPNAPGMLIHIASATNSVVGQAVLANGAQGLAATDDAVWVAVSSQLFEADPQTLALTPSISLATQVACGAIAADDTSVWIAGGICGFPRFALAKVDAKSGHSVAGPNVFPQAMAVALVLGSVWITKSDGMLERLNETTGAAEGSLKTNLGAQTVIDAEAGAIWVGSINGTVERFTPR